MSVEYDSTKYLVNKGNVDIWIKVSKQDNSSPLHQTCTPTVIQKHINLKVNHHTGVKWFIHDHKHSKENTLLNLDTDYP